MEIVDGVAVWKGLEIGVSFMKISTSVNHQDSGKILVNTSFLLRALNFTF